MGKLDAPTKHASPPAVYQATVSRSPSSQGVLSCQPSRPSLDASMKSASLRALDCRGCHSLQRLPEPLPVSLQILDCNGCYSLQRLPEPREGCRAVAVE